MRLLTLAGEYGDYIPDESGTMSDTSRRQAGALGGFQIPVTVINRIAQLIADRTDGYVPTCRWIAQDAISLLDEYILGLNPEADEKPRHLST